MTRLAVIGTGRIGGEVAFLAGALGIAQDLVLLDENEPLLTAQVLDLLHTGWDIPVSTDPADVRDADLCVYAAGNPRSPLVKTRADLLGVNLIIAEACLPHARRFGGLWVTVTNPADVLNYFFQKKGGLDRRRCIGFGGQLDSARFTLALRGDGIRAEGTVLGEHGEHQVPVFSRLPAPVEIPEREQILRSLRTSSMEVIRGKGGTVFGPAVHIAALLRALLDGVDEPVPCSCVVEGEYGLRGCSLGVPALLGKEGVREIQEWPLDPWEREQLERAGGFMKKICGSFDG
ncbi:MAG: lactate dehydrogenase [Methanomicrobiales archaeon]|nr:lactate dehydrogenase [Methanomicrobiales archaeon]